MMDIEEIKSILKNLMIDQEKYVLMEKIFGSDWDLYTAKNPYNYALENAINVLENTFDEKNVW